MICVDCAFTTLLVIAILVIIIVGVLWTIRYVTELSSKIGKRLIEEIDKAVDSGK